MEIDYNRWWKIEDGKFFEVRNFEESVIEEDYFYFPSKNAKLDVREFQNDCLEKMVEKIMEQKGAWSVVYYNHRNRKLIIGRDIFGRQSLVFNFDEMKFGCRATETANWIEVPFAQVTVLSMDAKEATVYAYLEEYPEGIFKGYLPNFKIRNIFVNNNADLLKVSRCTVSEDGDYPKLLFENVVKCTKPLIGGVRKIGVCLSGGVDSTFISHVAHFSVHRDVGIDLVNVAFGENEKMCAEAPDRSRAIMAMRSLREKYTNREFRLILVNVSSEQLNANRAEWIGAAAKPASSVLDDSLACVLWFAVRARGIDSETREEVVSTADTMLLGSGADELLAGYARHRNRFEKERIVENIAQECENELKRLGSRNGGRDARVAAQLGKTIISPLLEDDVVRWINALPITTKWDLSLPRGVGEKLLLRQAVRELGSPYDAPKQAMQFGSRMAKMSNNGNNSIKGSDKSPHLVVS